MKTKERYQNSLLRSDLYRVLSLGFDLPFEKNRREMEGILEDLSDESQSLNLPETLKRALKKLLHAVQNIGTAQWEEEYHTLFSGKVLCPAAEGSYHLTERGPILGDVTAFYKAFELNFLVREGVPDHIKMEIAFLSYLSLKEAHAIENGMLKEAAITANAQKSFLRDHLGRWGNVFAVRLIQNASLPFYKELAGLLHAWLNLEIKHFDIRPPKLPLTLPGAVIFPKSCIDSGRHR